ncbi:MAG TPA: hypothetical protein VFS12_18025 [Terriglobia bacterium]|nr:hypothetical protein [Terriglobia bacterium]
MRRFEGFKFRSFLLWTTFGFIAAPRVIRLFVQDDNLFGELTASAFYLAAAVWLVCNLYAGQIELSRLFGQVHLILAHSNQKEIEHPNTPPEVKEEAAGMIYTIETSLTTNEEARKSKIHVVLTGNGNPEKHAADATHVFDAGKYGGYFITTDQRILSKRKELSGLSPACVLLPSEWLKVFHQTAGG